MCALACALTPASAGASPSATITRTEHGIPHIVAHDFEGIGYGYGYAFAQDNLCVMAEDYITVRGERSRYFGPSGSYENRGNGSTANNLNSDFFYQRIINARTIEKLMDQPPPYGPRPEVKEAVRGYVEGYNKYLADTGVDNLSDPNCRGKPWVKPIEEIDAYRRFYQLALLASAGVAIDGIAEAQPPGQVPKAKALSKAAKKVMFGKLKDRLPLGAIGSNAVALGSEGTADGKGLLLGNPHFPWDGTERFYQAHLKIPGKLDVSGGSLFGVPIVLIGHTRNLAWSHTVSTAFRFTPFQVTLVPGSPTTYLVDGKPHQMKAERVTVQAQQGDGSLAPVSRTLYSTKYGPMFDSILGLPLFPWTPAIGYAMGDANAANFRYLNHFLETNMAQSVREYDQIERRNQGIPWVNSIAADSTGEAYYADIGVVPNVPDSKIANCNTPIGVIAFQLLGLPVLDGSRKACNWDNSPGALQKGTFAPSQMPSLFRRDYVTNSNDSYWLSNPNHPLEGFPRIIGDERTERSLRTRLGLRIVQQRLDGSDGLPGKGFTLQQLQDAVFNNRQYAGELWRHALVKYCKANPIVAGSSGPVDVSAACPVLAHWDLHDNLDSHGAILFRRFASHALGSPLPINVTPPPFSTPFNAADPVNTPNGLNTADPRVGAALGDAVTDLRNSGIPLDAPLRGYQYEMRGDEKIPIHGGPGSLGVFNAINVPWVAGVGYPNVPHGSSFVQVVHLDGNCPQARTILTYSQSTNPESPYFADQTRLFSQKIWLDDDFCHPDLQWEHGSTTIHIG